MSGLVDPKKLELRAGHLINVTQAALIKYDIVKIRVLSIE